MDSKDILEKARQEKSDEREEQIRIKAFHIGWLSVSAVMLFLIFFRSLHNESASDIVMILMAQTAAASYYKYFSMREKKSFLVAGIMSTIAVFLSLAALLSQYGVY